MRRIVAIALTAFALGAMTPSAASAREVPDDTVDRVLVVSLPTVSWDDLDDVDLPHLNGLLDRSAVADLSVRSVSRVTNAGDGYTTLGAGNRARGMAELDGLSFSPGARYQGQAAEDVFRLRSGVSPDDGLFSLAAPAVVDRNAGLRFDAEVGALGDALADAGVDRAVIANADGGDPAEPDRQREAVGALMGEDGTVPAGEVGETLLVDDAEAPFGRRLDADAVVETFDGTWDDDRSVVLVEASDVVRADAYRRLASGNQRDVLMADALRHTDELVGRLLERVDPERDAVLVVGPYHARAGVHLTVAGLRAPGVEPGLLRTASTRRAGFVTLGDVAPTVLDLLGVERPGSMEGRPFEATGEGASTAAGRRDGMIEANSAARFRDRMVGPATVLFVVLSILLWVVATVALLLSRPRLLQGVAIGALALLAFLPATYLAGLFPFERWGSGAYWGFLAAVSLVGAAVLVAVGRRGSGPLVAALSAVILLLLVDVVIGAPLQLNTVYGYSPTVAGRFAGFGNLAFAQLAAASLLLSGLLAHGIGGRKGVLAGIGVMAVVLVADGTPVWGSDVGGVLTLVPAAGLTAAMLLGVRVRLRTVLASGVAALVVVGVFGAIDLARPADSRTHLGRLLEQIGSEGFGSFETVVLRKLDANLAVLTRSIWTLMVPVIFGFIALLVWRAPGRLRQIQTEQPELQMALAGFALAAVLGFVLNDSGIAVPGLMLGVMGAALVFLVARTEAPGAPDP